MEESCGHNDDNFRLTMQGKTRRVCWECLTDDLAELMVNQDAHVTRLFD